MFSPARHQKPCQRNLYFIFLTLGALLSYHLTSCVQVQSSLPQWHLQEWSQDLDPHWPWLKSEVQNGSIRCRVLSFIKEYFFLLCSLSHLLFAWLSAAKQVKVCCCGDFQFVLATIVLECRVFLLTVTSQIYSLFSPGFSGNNSGPWDRSFSSPQSSGLGLSAVLLWSWHAQFHPVENSRSS